MLASWPAFEASAEQRAEWLTILERLRDDLAADILRFPWQQGFRLAHAQLVAVIAAYQRPE